MSLKVRTLAGAAGGPGHLSFDAWALPAGHTPPRED